MGADVGIVFFRMELVPVVGMEEDVEAVPQDGRGIGWKVVAKLAGANAFLDELVKDADDERLVIGNAGPGLLACRLDDVKDLPFVAKKLVLEVENGEHDVFQTLERTSGSADPGENESLELAEVLGRTSLDDCVLGGEELVDVGRRHPEIPGDVGDRRFPHSVTSEQLVGLLKDKLSGFFFGQTSAGHADML